MKSITPYLFFPGNCEEALSFYKEVFGGEITSIQRFGDANMPVDDDYKQKIMHAELNIKGMKLMFSDGAPHKNIIPGDNVHMNIEFEDETSMRLIWGKLEAEGRVHMSLQDTFWGAIFGQLEDKFGIRWMMSFQK